MREATIHGIAPKTLKQLRVDYDPDYYALERLVADRVAAISGPLFASDADGLFNAYLSGIPEASRGHYTCNCCRRFVDRYGGLVTVDEKGLAHPALWGLDDVPAFFDKSIGVLRKKLYRAKVVGVFINGDREWGNAVTGVWTHLHGTPKVVQTNALKNASQMMAEKQQDYIILRQGLADYQEDAVVQAVRVLQAYAVDRSEKTLGVAEWLLGLHRQIKDVRGSVRDNLIWLAVAQAPPGWCHIRSTMISTLLDDIIVGLPFEVIASRWASKMHPLRYQRPQTVSDGNIEQANKVVAKLQSAGALARRFARLEEVTALWRPRAIEIPATGGPGVFDHLKARSSRVKAVDLPAIKITWDKFKSTVLPGAAEIEAEVSHGSLPFFGLVTAADDQAPPILQWDGLEGVSRNPVSWYFYHLGSHAADWNLMPGLAKVNAICLKPCHWQSDNFAHQGHDVFFVLDKALDKRHTHGAGFFPEILKAEYREIRHALEAYVQRATIAERDLGTANGIALGEGLAVRVRSTVGDRQEYRITK